MASPGAKGRMLEEAIARIEHGVEELEKLYPDVGRVDLSKVGRDSDLIQIANLGAIGNYLERLAKSIKTKRAKAKDQQNQNKDQQQGNQGQQAGS